MDDHCEDLVAVERIEPKIVEVRGQRVILDADLAGLYGVETRTLNQAVKRNAVRFPSDFLFQVTPEEAASLRSQIVILEPGRGRHRKFLPYAFTEHGALMAANVLNSRRAQEASVFVIRAFVKLRQVVAAHQDLSRHLAELERRVLEHGEKLGKHDETLHALMAAIRELMLPPAGAKHRIGFHRDSGKGGSSSTALRPLHPPRRP